VKGLPAELAGRLAEAGLDPAGVERVVRTALEEDVAGPGDVTTIATIPEQDRDTADLVARESGVLAGLPVAEAVFTLAGDGDLTFATRLSDGTRVRAGDLLATVSTRTRVLLTAERTALNLLSRLCGTATLTRRWVDAVSGTGARIRDTRKTTPGLRALEKYAVRCGGGVNHRMNLSDAAVVKDNHVLAAGGVAEAYRRVRAAHPGLDIEAEVDRTDQLAEVLAAGADLILLDNMNVAEMAQAVRVVGGRARLEASGGLRLENARAVAETGVDYLSIGALTHSAPILDVALDLRPRRSA
jgi:nicotinate-nucleotide pyrophosphorylase (carboxylating)